MIKFKDFLKEEIYNRDEFKPKRFNTSDGDTVTKHIISRKIGDKNVDVYFDTQGHTNTSYVDFKVDDTFSNLRSNFGRLDHKMEALHFVQNSVHSFVHHFKPNVLMMNPNSSVKKDLYAKFGQKLARVHNGKFETKQHEMAPYGYHVISFKKTPLSTIRAKIKQ